MAEPFTEPAGKRRLIRQADRRSPPRRQYDGLEPHGCLDSASRFGGRRKLDRLEFDSGGAKTIQAGLIDDGFRLGLFRRRGVVRGGMGRLGRAWRWQGRGLRNGRAGGLQREGEHSGDYEKIVNSHVRDAGPLRELANPPHTDRGFRPRHCGIPKGYSRHRSIKCASQASRSYAHCSPISLA